MAYLDAVSRMGLEGSPARQYAGFAAAAASAVITGTLDGSTETNLVGGGRTYIWTLTNDTWLAAGTGPIGSIANTQALIDGIDSDQAEANGWDAERSNIAITDVVRTSDTVATLTLPALPNFDITINETLTGTVPAVLLVTSSIDVVATPTISITFVSDAAVSPSGGWIVRDVFDTLADRKRRNLKALRERLEEVKEIPGLDGEIAQLFHKDDEKELIESSLKELESLVKSVSTSQIEQEFNTRVAKSFMRASIQGNFSALQAFEREMERVREEEAFFLIAAVMILQ